MVTIRTRRSATSRARGAARHAFGAARFAKTAERLREGRLPADGLSFVADAAGRVVGTVRLWHVVGRPATAGAAARAARGRRRPPQARHRRGADAPRARATRGGLSIGAVLLVGDAPYYGRFGFSARRPARCGCPDRYERDGCWRCELDAGRARRRARAGQRDRSRSSRSPILPRCVAGLRRHRRFDPRRAARGVSRCTCLLRVPNMNAITRHDPSWPCMPASTARS